MYKWQTVKAGENNYPFIFCFINHKYFLLLRSEKQRASFFLIFNMVRVGRSENAGYCACKFWKHSFGIPVKYLVHDIRSSSSVG